MSKVKTAETSTEGTVVEMSREEFQQWEHEVQTGKRDILPNGRKISDVQQENESLQLAQEKIYGKKTDSSGEPVSDEIAEANEKVSVSISATGVMSARPAVEVGEEPTNNGSVVESDLPPKFPGRKELIAGKVTRLELVAKLDKDALILIDGIGDATADAILAYGKS